MNLEGIRLKAKIKLIMALTVGLAVGSQTVAYAETTTGSMGVNGGELELTAPSNVTLSDINMGDDTWMTAAGDLTTVTVNDSRGTGDGWKLLVEGGPIKEVGGKGLVMPTGSFHLQNPASVVEGGWNDATAPVLASDQQIINNGPVVIANAPADTGLGEWHIDFAPGAVQLDINQGWKIVDKVNYPSSATPYETTLTWTLSNTP